MFCLSNYDDDDDDKNSYDKKNIEKEGEKERLWLYN